MKRRRSRMKGTSRRKFHMKKGGQSGKVSSPMKLAYSGKR